MKIKIILTDGSLIVIEQNKELEGKEEVRNTILKILNSNNNFIRFNGNLFDTDLCINKSLIQSIVFCEVANENN